MQLKLEFTQKPKQSWVEKFGSLVIVAILILVVLSHKTKAAPADKENNKPNVKETEAPRLTLSQLKKYPGYENITEAEGNKVLDTASRLSRLMCELFIKKQKP